MKKKRFKTIKEMKKWLVEKCCIQSYGFEEYLEEKIIKNQGIGKNEFILEWIADKPSKYYPLDSKNVFTIKIKLNKNSYGMEL